ncbi:tRNA 2-thiouridine(34) synthase MnmA [Desulfovibrio litoralis]|uniref:tRNA-uridine 2-sulfurtransferase n=1 Tax=Desulfovibrio litoralis DSM 11393 TaxID=1121455 RepID=A0A1M7T139_9BACT|nr:tRNA 2-thiouridine(34) synthase MnmA [Desulfovibrio litoralis]SHN64470.1 tRNA (5-methylaminomethyl-2-thiouridylate)-methyltransferase [Desulfovibrio litoralis DSM 11393]
MSKIAVAVSGGADSLFALLRLREEGHEVFALHARLFPLDETQIKTEKRLETLCESLKIPLFILDLHLEFEKMVVTPFCKAWNKGETPNPCALCNFRIKFGLLHDKSLELGAEALATGHYVGIESLQLFAKSADGCVKQKETAVLVTGKDKYKDQSYFLALVPKERLTQMIFPLKDCIKTKIQQYLSDNGYSVPVAKESQEICFIKDDDYKSFLKMRKVKLSGGGAIVLASTGEKLGLHQGLWQYTEGQRRGLGIAYTEPLFVCGKDLEKNQLVVCTKSELAAKTIYTEKANLFFEPEDLQVILQEAYKNGKLWVKLRYRQTPSLAKVELKDQGFVITLASENNGQSAIMPPAAGQIAVVYTELPKGYLLDISGEIRKTSKDTPKETSKESLEKEVLIDSQVKAEDKTLFILGAGVIKR